MPVGEPFDRKARRMVPSRHQRPRTRVTPDRSGCPDRDSPLYLVDGACQTDLSGARGATMPTTATTDHPTVAVLGHQEREVLSAVGCGMRDDEVAAALAIPEDAVAQHLARILVKLGLRDRAAAIVHAFDCGWPSQGAAPVRSRCGPWRGPSPVGRPGRRYGCPCSAPCRRGGTGGR